MNQDKRSRLHAIIKQRSFSQGSTITLASGRESSFYFNLKHTLANPEALALVGDLVLEELGEEPCDFLGGMAMGAVPILGAVAMRSFQLGEPREVFWVRKLAKGHGTRETIEGQHAQALSGKRAVMLEDVTTTGGSVVQAVRQARGLGLEVHRVITIVDRGEGAAESLLQDGLTLSSLFVASDFFDKNGSAD